MSDWTCTACGQGSPAGTRFCGHCGTPAAAAAAPAVQTWACRACGTANLPTMVFCGGCGAKSQPERAEEMRLVTALFADLSGFTTLADTLAVEDLHDVIRPLVAGLARIAEQYGGFIEKYAGDALLVVFGAPVTHEDDAQRALLAALEMHAALPRLVSQLGPNAAHLTIHIGVNTGRVIAGRIGSEGSSDYAVLGDSVILAQRLESACPPGETYVGASTYALTSDDFEMESVGELVLKGKTMPVHAYRLIGRRSTGTSGTRPLVGREQELAAAEEGLALAAVTTVVGEPGAGKSRLLAELRHRAAARGVQWLAARCLSYGASLAYWPLADLLRQELRLPLATSAEDTAAALERALPQAALPGARRLLGLEAGGLPETARREVHDAVTAWLRQRAEAGPVVLVLEDLHWCDRSTVDLLAELVRVGDAPVALLLATRHEGGASAALIAGDGAHRVVEVGPLDEDGIAAVAGTVLGRPAAVGLGRLLLERSGGNPLHVVELARSLSESNALVETVQGWDLRPGWDLAAVPTSIERVLATRVDALPPAAAAVLQLASVVGRKVRVPILQAVHDGGDLDAALQTLSAAAMLEPDSHTGEAAFTFSHALLQDVVYARLLRKRRRELHRRVADAARRLYGDADDSIALLARHLYLAEADEEAVEPLLRAGRRAAGLYANDEAAVHLEHAVEVLERLGQDEPLPEVRLELAALQERRGAYDEALRLYRSVVDGPHALRARRGEIATLRAHGRYEDALRVFAANVRPVPADPDVAALFVECALALTTMGRQTDSVSTNKTGLKLLGDADPRLRGLLLTQLAHAEEKTGRIADAVRHAEEAVDLLDRTQSLPDLVRALRIQGAILAYADRADEARATLERAQTIATRIGLMDEAASALLNAGLVAFRAGDYAVAEAAWRDAMALFERIGLAGGRAMSYGNLADALMHQGRLDDAEHWADKALDVAVDIGHAFVRADVTRTKAGIAAARGEHQRARELLQDAARAFAELDSPGETEDCLRLAAALPDADALLT